MRRLPGWRTDTEDIRRTFSGDEIVLRDLLSVFWERRLLVAALVVFFFLLAVIKVTTTPASYATRSTYISEAGLERSSVTGGFAELLGFSEASMSGRASGVFSDPQFYPSIIASRPFLMDLAKEEFFFQYSNQNMSLGEFVTRYEDRDLVARMFSAMGSLPRRIGRLFSKSEKSASEDPIGLANVEGGDTTILVLTKADISVMTKVAERIIISNNGNLIVVETEMPDPVVCAQFNQLVSRKLLQFIIDKETDKERRDLQYIERRVASAKDNFETSQRRLAGFRDRNRGVVSATAKSEEERLQSEYSIDFGIYQKLATELEEKRIALEERTPVFSVFEPSYVPPEPAKQSDVRTIIVFVLLGIFLGIAGISGVAVRTLIRKGE